MSSFEHKKLVSEISQLEDVPADGDALERWLNGEGHLRFLEANAHSGEVVVAASGSATFVNTVVVPNDKLKPIDQQDLMRWNFGLDAVAASYVIGGQKEKAWIERGLTGTASKTMDGGLPLVFARTFNGWQGPGRHYVELAQEVSHVLDVHWRPERRAYCTFDEHGDIEDVVSVTTFDEKPGGLEVVSFLWKPLEEYLAAADSALVRMFDIVLMATSSFSGWPNQKPVEVSDSEGFFYRRLVMPKRAAYVRGVQIIRPGATAAKRMTDELFGRGERKYVEFVAHDIRNDKVCTISTDPDATTNYFSAAGNTLPFELSPAFFRPEVLSKYKTDHEKYTVGSRDVTCRSSWYLKAFDVNEAGQVHAYICYLRNLPYEEQLHWRSYNEPPKSGISERAVAIDFQGRFADFDRPLEKLLARVRRWHETSVEWWRLRGDGLLDRVSSPISASQDEWAEAFMDLAKLVVEGFDTKPIRRRLEATGVAFDKEDRTIALLEKLLSGGQTESNGGAVRLSALRTVQNLRSKAKGHASGSEGRELAQEALTKHETYADHFQHICSTVLEELKEIEKTWNSTGGL